MGSKPMSHRDLTRIADQVLTVEEIIDGKVGSNPDIKLTHLLTLLQRDYVTVKIVFGKHPAPVGTRYTYKASKFMALKLGDPVVVYAKERLAIGYVYDVDTEPDIDLERPYALKWVVQKVDTTNHDAQSAREYEALNDLKAAQRAATRKTMLESILGTAGMAALEKKLNGG